MAGITKRRSNKDKKRSKAPLTKTPPKALPVTLLSGFLGSGKTTLLQHVLRSKHGLRIAVIVNDIGAINIDAGLIRSTHHLTKTEEKVVALQNGCICCTLRGDLLEELVRLSELAEFDYIIIESSGISEPEQVAETFDSRLAETIGAIGEGTDGLDADMLATLKRLREAGGLDKFARLDTTVTVIDAFTIYHDLGTAELLSSRRDDVVPEDERTISDLMVDQIEFADVIILNKIDMVSDETRGSIKNLIKDLNHRAKMIETHHGKVDVKEILNTGMFSLEKAQTGYGWLQDLHAMTLREVNGRKKVTPKPETEEYNVRNFIYTRRRPFHPFRLFRLLHDKFILQHPFEDEEEDEDEDEEGDEDEDEEMDGVESEEKDEEESKETTEDRIESAEGSEDASLDADSSKGDEASSVTDASIKEDLDLDIPDPQKVLANKSAHPIFAKLFRSKGEYWLATRPDRAGEWSQAGAMLTLRGGREWFCCVDRKEWETGTEEVDELVEHDMIEGGEWGDRRQELVFIGEALDHEKIEETLDECLLNDEEWESWQRVMRQAKNVAGKQQAAEYKEDNLAQLFDDGFPDWPEEEEHDHEH